MERWNKRVAFVSGVSTHIGAYICRRLVEHGMIVIACGSNDFMDDFEVEIKELDFTGELHAIRYDLFDEIGLLAIFHEIRSKFERIDVCVNVAGFTSVSSFRECNTIDLRKNFQENIFGISFFTRESLQLMNENKIKDGQIIQVVQIEGTELVTERRISDSEMYNSTQFIIGAYTEALRQELRRQGSGIRVACIRPKSEMTDDITGELMEGFHYILYQEPCRPELFVEGVIDILETPTDRIVKDVVLQLDRDGHA